MINDGVDNILDGLRNLMDDYSEWLNKEELKERKISKISNLKIQFHKNFGYYISINKSKVNLAPQHWIKGKHLLMKKGISLQKLKIKKTRFSKSKIEHHQGNMKFSVN